MVHLATASALVLIGAVTLRAQTAPPPARPAPQTGTGVIRGQVTAADTALPLPNARLTLAGVAAGDQTAESIEPVLSDSEGRFQFIDLPAGSYTVRAAKAGYLNARFGARTYFDLPINVVVVDGAAADNINIALVKSAAISGRILDDLGDPAIGASVSVSRRVRVDGRERLSYVKGTQTDDLGDYRLGGLPAGNFIVTVGGGGGRATRWTRTFFPGVVDLARAQAVSVRAGDEIGGRDFAASPVGGSSKPAKLSGTVINAAGGPAAGRLIHATIDEPPGTASTSSQPIPANGEFSFQPEPGEHLFIAQGANGDVAALRVTVGEADVTGLRLVLGKGGRVTGRVVFEGTTTAAAPEVELDAWSADFESRLVASMPGSTSPLRTVRPNRDGTFEIPSLFAAREIRVRTAPPGWLVKSITVEGRSIADTPIDFDGGRELAGVQILMTNRAAQLTGTVTDGERRAVKEYSVVMFADDPSRARRPSRVAQWVRPDQNGRFVVDGLAPGAYSIAAVDQVTDDQWSNIEYLDQLRARATRVTLADGEKRTITLERMSAP
jgi:hypothetical protein